MDALEAGIFSYFLFLHSQVTDYFLFTHRAGTELRSLFPVCLTLLLLHKPISIRTLALLALSVPAGAFATRFTLLGFPASYSIHNYLILHTTILYSAITLSMVAVAIIAITDAICVSRANDLSKRAGYGLPVIVIVAFLCTCYVLVNFLFTEAAFEEHPADWLGQTLAVGSQLFLINFTLPVIFVAVYRSTKSRLLRSVLLLLLASIAAFIAWQFAGFINYRVYV